MSKADANGSRRRRLLLPVLVAYVAALVLAAWPELLRPGLLDAPHHAAYRLLGWVGIKAGQAVFTIEDSLEYGTVADCHYVRGVEAAGPAGSRAVVDVWPADGRCVKGGFRFRLPPREIFHTRTLLRALLLREDARFREGLLRAVARPFCRRADGEPPFASVDVAWIRDARRYDDATPLRQPVLTYSWQCAEERVTRQRWFPDERAVRAFWGGEPWQ